MRSFSSGNGREKPHHNVKIRNSSGVHIKIDTGWIIKIIIFAFVVSICFSLFSEFVFSRASIVAAPLVLLLFISIGIGFDIVGVAVTAADERPFHSMAAKKTRGAKEALVLIRNAEKVASFCNDVVGDVVGIASGAAVISLVSYIMNSFKVNEGLLTLITTGVVAALTIGGKAIGKTFAINNCNNIIYFVAVICGFFPINFDKLKKKLKESDGEKKA